MPKRTVRPYKFEAESERGRPTPGMERRLWTSLPKRRAPEDLSKWREAVTPLEKFYAAPGASMAAYHLREYGIARDISEEALAVAPSFTDNWNHGNAVHYGHTVLGLLAVQRGDLELAARELVLSAEVRGSPQLNSFGPSMRLARELLKRGLNDPVLHYFRLCRAFWKMGDRWLDIWEKKVSRGAIPLFVMQSSR